MFDISFSELLIIGIVALIVIGPERLPKVARVAGHFFGRAQRYVNTVKADIQREMQLEELKKLQEEMKNSVHSFESSLRTEINTIEKEGVEIAESLPKASEFTEDALLKTAELADSKDKGRV